MDVNAFNCSAVTSFTGMSSRQLIGMRFLLKATEAVRGAYTGKYSIITNTVTAGTLGFFGDVIAQKTEQRTDKFSWDARRTRNMTIVCVFAAPVMHYWYRFLDKKYPGRSLTMVSKKLGLDMLSGPLWYGWYIGGLSLLRGSDSMQLVNEMKSKIPIIAAVDVALWPIFQGLNFKFFPPQYRILVLKCNELVLDVIFSHIANNEYTLSTWIDAIRNFCSQKS